MDDRTLEALKGSIAKWEAIVAGTGTDQGGDNCPLCAMFIPKKAPLSDWCRGCPVSAHVGRMGCQGTPYFNASVTEGRCGAASPEYKAAAQAELDFLRSLLPEEHRERREESQERQAAPSA